MSNPKGTKGLHIREIGNEVIVFDPEKQVAHRVSRRDFMRKAGIAATAALAVPIIDSVTVPAQAAGGRCFGKHTNTAKGGIFLLKADAEKDCYAASVAKAEAICRSFECDDGECVSNGHPVYLMSRPKCLEVRVGDNKVKWECAIGFDAVCRCVGNNG